MKLVIQFAIVFLVMLAITGQSVANADTIMHLAQKFSDDGYYSIDINSVDSLESVLRISCAEKCKSNLSYSETISGFFPRGAFGDGNTFTTLWSAGSAEWIIIYRIHSGTVTKVLQQPSRTLPDFEADPDGRKIIVLHNDTPGCTSIKNFTVSRTA